MKQNVLQSIDGVEIFPIIGLIIFFGVFMYAIIEIMRADKSHIRQMSEMPLDLDTSLENENPNPQ